MTPRQIFAPAAVAILALVALQLDVAGPVLASDAPSIAGRAGPSAHTKSATTPSLAEGSLDAPANSPKGGPEASTTPHLRNGRTGSAESAARLQDRLDQLRRDLGIPGVQATVLYPDGTSWTGVSGLADIATGASVEPETPFALASVSKMFTAAVILELVGEGLLDLDESVAARLPSLGLNARITVRQLLDHTSGLNDYLVSRTVDRALRADLDAAWTAERALSYVGKPYFLPGRGWHYSNTNYVVLGLLAEQVKGIPLAESIRTLVLEPLGLSTVSYQGVEESTAPVARAYRFAVGPPGGAAIEWRDGSTIVPFRSVVTATAGAGSIAASSADVARFARAIWGGDLLPGWVLGEAIADALRVGAIRGALPYGLGVQAYAVDGRAALGHSGRFSGARAVVRYIQDAGITIAVLTNQSRIDPAIILSRLLEIAAPVERAPQGFAAS